MVASHAQLTLDRRIQRRDGRRCGALLPVFSMLASASLTAMAQDDGLPGLRNLVVQPRVTVTQTLTENVQPGSGEKRSDAITQIAPGLRLSTRSARLEGELDYSLSGVLYARRDDANQVQQSLSARMKSELIEDFAFFDARAVIAQQSISAFGLQTPSTGIINDNRTEVSTIQLSPYLQGRLGDTAIYTARMTHSITRSSASENGDLASTMGALRIDSAAATWRLRWLLDLSHQTTDYSASRKTESSRLLGGLSYRASNDLLLSARVGREFTDLLAGSSTSYSTSGWSVNWTPSQRTTLGFDQDRRFFGTSHSLRFEHRTPRTAWRASSTRGVSVNPAGTGAFNGTASVYDLLFQQFASVAPDPVQRAALVNDYLRINGLSGETLTGTGVLAGAATEDRRTDVSFALLGVRSSLVLLAYSGATRRLDPIATAIDDLSGGGEIRQRGLGATVSHRLTPSSALSFSANLQETSSSRGGNDTRLRSTTLGWTDQVARRASLFVGARRALFDNPTRSYSENALFATLTFTF